MKFVDYRYQSLPQFVIILFSSRLALAQYTALFQVKIVMLSVGNPTWVSVAFAENP